ncbi:MAG TPA: 50S ribosomal protein L18 [Acidobacteriota bacterium]
MLNQRRKKKELRRRAVRQRIQRRVRGTTERPRLSVFRSDRHVHLQVIDDVQGKTLVSLSTQEPAFKEQGFQHGATVAAAAAAGKLLGERAKAAGISRVIFDRGGYAYHGRVRAIADAAREVGLEF